MVRSLFAVCAAFLSSALFGAEPEPIGPQLLTNGGFEQIAPGADAPSGWRGFFSGDWGDCAGEVRLSRDNPHQGTNCLAMLHVRGTYAAAHSQRVPIASDRTYLLTGWIRTQLTRGQSAYLVASWFGEKRWLALTKSRALAGRRPWTRVSLVLSPEVRPDDATTVQVSFRISGSSAGGRAWVDDISLRECQPSPPGPGIEAERQRLLDMARELMIERNVWQERLSVLQQRRADLQQLLAEDSSFEELKARHGHSARARAFLTRASRPREELARDVPDDNAEIRGRIDLIQQLPALRQKCYAELEAILGLKRELDAHPALRRFYSWAQLAAMRPHSDDPSPQPLPARPTPEFEAALANPPGEPSGELLDIEVRTKLDPGANRGVPTLSGSPVAPRPGDSVQAGLLAPGDKLVAFASAPAERDAFALRMELASPDLWFPDCRCLYTLRIGLFRDGRAVDWAEQKVAFRDVRICESDVTATMRHAWAWPLADHTFAINGQPYFPRGTVCGQARQYPDEAAPLFRELWLDYQRTYGSFLSRLSESDADTSATLGLTYIGSLAPRYANIRSYVSSREGLEDYREMARQCRWLGDHPALLAIEVGNEAELTVWGADLQSVYGEDLWHVFNEATRVLREEIEPQVPVGYVRARQFHQVLPLPREDYSGVNQYTGRYWGRRCTMTSDIGALSLAAAYDNKPIGIMEWNGPKYSWATRGVSGVDEEGAAQYVFDYFRTMLRTPATVLSTEFVLNWIATPLEDLTTMPLAEGLKRRDQWRWFFQKGVPWYPAIWPDLLTDTPARRAMRGFQSPLLELCEAPGEVLVAAGDSRQSDAQALTQHLRDLGKRARAVSVPDAKALAQLDANLLLIGSLGDDQPHAVRELEQMRVIGRTTHDFPAPGESLIQRRVNPFFPDRFLVVVTAADAPGMTRALNKLAASAEGLREAYARHATCRRALALVDDDEQVARAFTRYVLELPTRSMFLGRDDLRTRLTRDELLDEHGNLTPSSAGLAAVIVATRRALSDDEQALLRALPAAGVNVLWSAAALKANPSIADALALRFGETRSLTDNLPVAPWAQRPLAIPDIGDVAADRVQRFARLKPGTDKWRQAMTASEIAAGPQWRAAATTETGAAVVVMRPEGKASHWIFGGDLAAAAVALKLTTSRGVIHSMYDRDTACGLERLFRLLANASAFNVQPRPASTPRLHAEIVTDKETYQWGDTVRVRVAVRDAQGDPCDASVRVSSAEGRRFLGPPGNDSLWSAATELAPGLYQVLTTLPKDAKQDAPALDVWQSDHRSHRLLTIFADVVRPAWVSDWTSHTVRVTSDTDEPERMERLAHLITRDLAQTSLHIRDKEQWVEVDATLTMPATIRPARPATFEVSIQRVGSDSGDDWMEDIQLVLDPDAGGQPIHLPLAAGKCLSGPRASVLRKRPDDCIVVNSSQPAPLATVWHNPRPGRWSVHLRYYYSDDYHIQDTNRLLREDSFPRAIFEVRPAQSD